MCGWQYIPALSVRMHAVALRCGSPGKNVLLLCVALRQGSGLRMHSTLHFFSRHAVKGQDTGCEPGWPALCSQPNSVGCVTERPVHAAHALNGVASRRVSC